MYRELLRRNRVTTTSYCTEQPYTFNNAPQPWKEISESVDVVIDIEWVNKNAPIPKDVVWYSVPEEEQIAMVFKGNNDLSMIFNDNFASEYRRLRSMSMGQ